MPAHAATLSDGMEKMSVVTDTYYLSMYIVECSLKWAIFKHSGHNIPDDIETFNCSGYTKNHIFKHKYGELTPVLQGIGFDISTVPAMSSAYFATQNGFHPENQTLFDNWRVEFRYETVAKSPATLPPITIDNIQSLVKACGDIYKGLISPPLP